MGRRGSPAMGRDPEGLRIKHGRHTEDKELGERPALAVALGGRGLVYKVILHGSPGCSQMGFARRRLRAVCPPGSLENHAPPSRPRSISGPDPAHWREQPSQEVEAADRALTAGSRLPPPPAPWLCPAGPAATSSRPEIWAGARAGPWVRVQVPRAGIHGATC